MPYIGVLYRYGRTKKKLTAVVTCLQAVLEDVISWPESFSGDVLLRTRRSLGVSEVVSGGMHLDIYQSAIQVIFFFFLV